MTFFFKPPYRNQPSGYNSLLDVKGWFINQLKGKLIFSLCKTFPDGRHDEVPSPGCTWSPCPNSSIVQEDQKGWLPSGDGYMCSSFSPAIAATENAIYCHLILGFFQFLHHYNTPSHVPTPIPFCLHHMGIFPAAG